MLTSRERVLRILNHREPDRVPFAFDCSQQDKVEDLCRHYGVTTADELFTAVGSDTRFCMCWDDVSRINRFDSDERYVDMWGIERSVIGMYPQSHPLAAAESIKDLERYDNWPSPDNIDYQAYAAKAEDYGDLAVLGGMWSCFMEVAEGLLGTEKYMIMMMLEPDFMDFLLDKIVGFYLECNRRMFDTMKDRMQVFFMGDDYGSQRDLLWSPEVWRRFVKPRLKKLYDLAHMRDYKVMQHSCGSVVKVIPDMIEIGLDVLQPIQVCAEGMDPMTLKQQFGDQLSFMGGVDAQQVLPFGTPQEVQEEVRRRIEVFAPGGGYILSTSQGIMPDVPIENFLAMLTSIEEFGVY